MSIEDFRIEDHASGGLQITHLASPRFRARWTTGEFPVDQVRDGAFFWTDEGASEDDTIHLYDLEWLDQVPDATGKGALPVTPSRSALPDLMARAVMAIDNYTVQGKE